MSVEHAVNLAPGSMREADCRPNVLLSLDGGEGIIISDGWGSSMEITRSPHSVVCFIVQKVLYAPNSALVVGDAVNEWSLDSPRGVINPENGVDFLLLGPSMVYPRLFGGEQPPDKYFARSFGTISLEPDPDEEDWLLKITMPTHPYKGLAKLSITQAL